MSQGEADTGAKLIDPATHRCGWAAGLIRREETAGSNEIGAGEVHPDTRPVVVAAIETKTDTRLPVVGVAGST